jgi:hypothetical protein
MGAVKHRFSWPRAKAYRHPPVMRLILEAKMICSDPNKPVRCCGRLLGAAMLLFASACGAALAQQAPAANSALQSGEPAASSPPAWQRFDILQETPEEREEFLKRREAAQAARPAREVAPLAAQAITVPPAQAVTAFPDPRP